LIFSQSQIMLQQKILPSSTSPLPLSSSLSIAFNEQSGLLHESYASALLHEVRNPLTNIRLAVEMLQDVIKYEHNKSYLDIIGRASLKIEELINNLILNHQPGDQQSQYYSMHKLLDEILNANRDRLLMKKINVRKDYCATDFKTFGDRSRMLICLSNIIINAIDAMELQNGELTVLSQLFIDRFVVAIKDNGCGMGPETLKRISTPYFTTKKNGLGVGLTATYEILKANKIDIEVRSKPGKGSSFILSFKR
jgi:signal transduction histidine kinase